MAWVMHPVTTKSKIRRFRKISSTKIMFTIEGGTSHERQQIFPIRKIFNFDSFLIITSDEYYACMFPFRNELKARIRFLRCFFCYGNFPFFSLQLSKVRDLVTIVNKRTTTGDGRKSPPEEMQTTWKKAYNLKRGKGFPSFFLQMSLRVRVLGFSGGQDIFLWTRKIDSCPKTKSIFVRNAHSYPDRIFP